MEFTIIIFIATIICLGMAIYVTRAKNEEAERQLDEKGIKYNAIYSIEVQHVCGLSLTENSECIIHLCDNMIVVESLGNIFKLQKDRIIDISTKTSKEIQNSISGAVGGYLLLGPIGAFLNGSKTDFHRFFVIIYKNKDNKEHCISFDLKDDIKKYKKVYNYIENFKKNITTKREIEI